jgi:hypothetical protein
MRAMMLARQHPDPSVRRALIQDAFEWLDRYFDAEDIELARRENMPVRRGNGASYESNRAKGGSHG